MPSFIELLLQDVQVSVAAIHQLIILAPCPQWRLPLPGRLPLFMVETLPFSTLTNYHLLLPLTCSFSIKSILYSAKVNESIIFASFLKPILGPDFKLQKLCSVGFFNFLYHHLKLHLFCSVYISWYFSNKL